MGSLQHVVLFGGAAVALGGLALCATFVGDRTMASDPLASSVVEPFTVWTQLAGILVGMGVVALGVAMMRRADDSETGPDR